MAIDLLHRLNPFSRPPSAQSHQHSQRRPLSSASALPPRTTIDEDLDLPERAFLTPQSQELPPSPSRGAAAGHHRTPSILRSLAHHPSLSALRSRSKKRRAKRPPLPTSPHLPAGVSRRGQDDYEADYDSSSVRKLRKASLKGSRSIPRDMRLNGSVSPASADSVPPMPPLPPTSPTPLQRSVQGRAMASRRPQTVHTPDHRSTHASVHLTSTPGMGHVIDYDHSALDSPDSPIVTTPDSVRVRRMRFEIEIESPGRRRGMSTSAVDVAASPPKLRIPGSPHTRHLSTPASPSHPFLTSPSLNASINVSPPRMVPPSSSHLAVKTQQHPHPIPRHLTPSSELDDSTPFYSNSDFEPVMSSPDRERPEIYDDGLDLLVAREELPVGTPGGKKADLRRGVLVDGAKHEKDAVRFFSRDTYSPADFSPSTFDSPASSEQSRRGLKTSPSTATSKVDKRSSSPFEVKLTPMVTKRMSLDAFGTPSPDGPAGTGYPAEEELLEDFDGDGDEDYDSQCHDQDGFQTTRLSTIRESPSSFNSTPLQMESQTATPPTGRTTYHTPPSRPARLNARGLPLPSPPQHCYSPPKHSSAPPLGITQALLAAHADHTKALKKQISASQLVIEELQAEARQLRDALEEETDEKRKALRETSEKQRMLSKTQEDLASSARELTLSQATLAENEEFLEKLQDAHDQLASQVSELREERAGLLADRQRTEDSLRAAHMVQLELGKEVSGLRAQTTLLTRQLSDKDLEVEDLKDKMREADKQLEATADEYTEHLALYDRDLQRWRTKSAEQDKALADLHERLSAAESKEDLSGQVKELKEMLAEKEEVVETLREKLRTAKYAQDETQELAKTQIKELEQQLATRDQELEEERSTRTIEREELVYTMEQAKEDAESLTVVLENRITELEDALNIATETIAAQQSELDSRSEALSRSTSELEAHRSRLHALQVAAEDADEASLRTSRMQTRTLHDLESQVSQLASQLDDAKAQLAAQTVTTRTALVSAETEKAKSADLTSRLSAYASEIDRLTLAQASLQATVAEVRRTDAAGEIRRLELEKQVERLQQDKELLNVALESKQTELALLQRGAHGAQRSIITPASKRLVGHPFATAPSSALASGASSRVSSTPGIETPAPVRGPTTAIIRPRRESLVNATPRGAAAQTPLGSSTRHNRVAAPAPAQLATSAGAKSLGASAKGKEVTRRTSLPVLVKRPPSGTGKKVSMLPEEDEGNWL